MYKSWEGKIYTRDEVFDEKQLNKSFHIDLFKTCLIYIIQSSII